jgi:hypothetical protein
MDGDVHRGPNRKKITMAFNPEDLKFRNTLKAYAGLLGSVLTAVLATQAPGSTLFTVLTVLAAVATAVGVWAAPKPAEVVVVQPDVEPTLQDDGANPAE